MKRLIPAFATILGWVRAAFAVSPSRDLVLLTNGSGECWDEFSRPALLPWLLMGDAKFRTPRMIGASVRSLLTSAIWAVIAIHAGLILVLGHHSVAASRYSTAAIPVLAAFCLLWRAQRLPARERLSWRWLSLALLLWATGQVVETLIGQSTAASNLAVDASDFLYVTAAFPVLLAISSTRETESIRAVSYLDSAQILLAFFLTYVRLFKMRMPPVQAATIMGRIYAAECSLLAISAIVRLVSWSTQEEQRRIRALCGAVWIYLPIELGMDYASKRWNLHAGTLLDLLWSLPFLFAARKALYMPIDETPVGPRRFGRGRLVVESLCPILVTAGTFALAASIANQYSLLALSAIFLLLLIQSLHAGVVQLNYLAGQDLLLEQEKGLREANTALERLSVLDPLTGIPNRRRFTSALEDAWQRAMRRQEPIAVLMIDIDFFKGINDFHGHGFGDECLANVARALARQVSRSDDLLARYGGEEFVVLLSEADERGAVLVAEQMHAAIAQLDVSNEASPFEHRMTVSVGAGITVPKPGIKPAALLEIADQALYEAKHRGRDRVCARTLA
jgi:diguanylate cyclase (GGDEF)-like protein